MLSCSKQSGCVRFHGCSKRSLMTYTPGHPLVAARAGSQPDHSITAPGMPQQQQQPNNQATKTIYLIRHGEGYHNIGYDHNLDAHLTPRGWAQTAALQQHLQAVQPEIQLVVVSPLRRTLETAAGVFGAKALPASAAAPAAAAAAAVTTAAAAAAGSSHSDGWLLMQQQIGRPYEVTPQQVLYLPPVVQRRAVIAAAGAAAAGAAVDAAVDMGSSVAGAGAGAGGGAASEGDHQPLRLLAHEGCRERIGPNVCDKFRPISQQATDFPGVDFSLVQHSTDVMWEALHAAQCHDGGCYLTGEEESHCERRALEFYAWLLDRPESVIAVVSHCGFLVHGMHALGKGMFKAWGDCMMTQLKANSNAPNASVIPAPSTVSGYIPAAPYADAAPFSTPGVAPTQPGSLPSGGAEFESCRGQDLVGVPGGSQLSSNNSSSAKAAEAAEAVRQGGAELTGWMSADWMNCECRSIQLAWGSAAQLLSGPAAAAAVGSDGAATTAGGDAAAAGRFLYAKPGDSSTWFRGGMYGIAQQI